MPADITVQIVVPGETIASAPLVSSERRVSPSWTIEHWKAKLESVTGIPPSCQNLRTRDVTGVWVTLNDEDSLVGSQRWGLRSGSEIEVCPFV